MTLFMAKSIMRPRHAQDADLEKIELKKNFNEDIATIGET